MYSEPAEDENDGISVMNATSFDPNCQSRVDNINQDAISFHEHNADSTVVHD